MDPPKATGTSGITLEVIEYAPHADVVVLATGDGDFDLLVHRSGKGIRYRSKSMACRKLSAGSLIRAASRFIPIKESLLLGIK